jgi:hypothetical protein
MRGDLHQIILELVLDFRHQAFNRARGDRTFFERTADAFPEFIAVKGIQTAVRLRDHQGDVFEAFVGGKALMAGLTLTATADDTGAIQRPGIEDTVLLMTTVGTLHGV